MKKISSKKSTNVPMMRIAAACLVSMSLAAPAEAATQIEWWHAMGGKLGEKVDEIAANFNASQSDYELKAVYKGNYTETMTAAIAAFRARKQPHVVQVFEVGTATMMAAKGAVYPVYQLMADTGQSFDPSAYLSSVTGYYTDTDGNMLSMPFNSSTPVLYYNKTAFEKAGLDPNQPPATWPEVEAAAKATQAAGYACGFTTGWQSWVHLENFSAWHDVPFGTKSNGFEGLDTNFSFNSPPQVAHITAMGEWQKSKIFDYGGRRSDSAPKFYTQDCVMYMNSSAAYAGVKTNVKDFEFGVGMLPYWPNESDTSLVSLAEMIRNQAQTMSSELASKIRSGSWPSATEYANIMGQVVGMNTAADAVRASQEVPQNSIIGGATLWVLRGREAEEYKGVAAFFAYLSSAEVQADWHQFTGYLPITHAAAELTKSQGFYDENPGTDVAIKQMTNKAPTANSKGLRFGSFVQVRDVINEELEAVWAGSKSAQAALDAAVAKGNSMLRKFEKANSK